MAVFPPDARRDGRRRFSLPPPPAPAHQRGVSRRAVKTNDNLVSQVLVSLVYISIPSLPCKKRPPPMQFPFCERRHEVTFTSSIHTFSVFASAQKNGANQEINSINSRFGFFLVSPSLPPTRSKWRLGWARCGRGLERQSIV